MSDNISNHSVSLGDDSLVNTEQTLVDNAKSLTSSKGLTEAGERCLRLFARKFELTNRLRETYQLENMSKAGVYAETEHPHALLGFVLSMRNNAEKDLRYLNVLLKVNDRLLALKNRLEKPAELAATIASVRLEMDATLTLARAKNILIT